MIEAVFPFLQISSHQLFHLLLHSPYLGFYFLPLLHLLLELRDFSMADFVGHLRETQKALNNQRDISKLAVDLCELTFSL